MTDHKCGNVIIEKKNGYWWFKNGRIEFCPFCGIELKKTKEVFPKKMVVYLHSDKVSMWNKGENLGLSEKAISENFMVCCYEVAIHIEVYEDGTYKILSVSE